MTKELFKEYSEIKNSIKELELRADNVSKLITDEMNEAKADKIESDYGSFYFTTRKSWKYSENVDIMLNAVKVQKKIEEEKGVATFEENKSLTFKSK